MTRARTYLFVAIVWTATVTVAIALGLVASTPTNELALAVVLFITVAAGENLELTFMVGKRDIDYVPYTAPILLGAIYLSPQTLMALVLITCFVDRGYFAPGISWWKSPLNSSTIAVAAGATGVLVQRVGLGNTHSALVLPSVFVAGVLFQAFLVGLIAFFFELSIKGAGSAFLRECRTVAIFDVCASTVAAALAAPFIPHPFLALLVLGLFQGGAYLLSKVSTSENLHRMKASFLRDTFSRYVPAHVADQIESSGQEIQLGGEEREISVLFADIRGFTSWSEHAEPEVVVAQLNLLLGGLSGAVRAHDGTLDKYTGDGLMAFWGAPLDQPDHAERACHAALAMLDRLDQCNALRAADGLPPFAIGIGVHSGRAVVGNIGHEERLDYTAIGDTVNLAARLEAATKKVGEVLLISGATWGQLPHHMRERCLAIGSIEVKGRSQAVEVLSLPRLPAAGEGLDEGDDTTIAATA